MKKEVNVYEAFCAQSSTKFQACWRSPEDELLLKSELNLKQKIVHSKNTSNIFLNSLLTFFTDNDVNYLDLWNALSWIQQIWGQFCLAFIEEVYVRKK